MTKINIVLMTFNRALKLDVTLKRITPHLSENIKLKILDNNSSDDTQNVVKKYLNQYCTYIKNNVNIGATLNYIKALEISDGEYIWVICDDDEYHFEYINKLLLYVNEFEPDVIMIGLSVNDFDIQNYISSDDNNTFKYIYERNFENIVFNFGFIPAVLYKKNIINNKILEYLYTCSDSYFPQNILHGLLRKFRVRIFDKCLINKPQELMKVDKLLIFQMSWLRLSSLFQNEFKINKLQEIIYPSFIRATLRILDAIIINIGYETSKNTRIRLIEMIFMINYKLKVIPFFGIFISYLPLVFLNRVRNFLWKVHQWKKI